MEYIIRGEVMQVVEFTLDQGESVFTEAGGMGWMTENIDMHTDMPGGIMGGLRRAVSGESMFMTHYRCNHGTGYVTFTTETPGNIVAKELSAGETIVCQRDAFMVAEESVELDMHFHRRLGAGLFGGEGFILQKVTGPGMVFFELAGEITEYELETGQALRVDPGHVGLLDLSVDFDIDRVKGVRNIFFGGEGLFLANLRGPGRVSLQSMPLANLAARLAPYLPSSKD